MQIAPCITGQLRLAGGNIDNEGRVEICMNNVWGTVCSDFWDTTDATVACQELGYSTDGQKHLLPCTALTILAIMIAVCLHQQVQWPLLMLILVLMMVQFI